MEEWKKIVTRLQLVPHIEGGYYREIYRSSERVKNSHLAERNLCASIYYLLCESDFSRFHRIQSDEIWHYYSGNTRLAIYTLQQGQACRIDYLDDESPFLVVKANTWFSACLETCSNTYVLAGCTTSPAFDYRDFEIADRQQLLYNFPESSVEIVKLT
ncbi:MAG: cupin domain-containing protein [Bacteroidales bacterium]|nr:cupin domain-containing protein [Bacteroidales bacterium]HOY39770.1 cupin domain-containing protein [Bacteroidales bacterium]HQP03868.1 cupin domain-containing protein [Bacteroidales bacterium]